MTPGILLNQEVKSVQPSSPSAFAIGRTVGILLLLQLTSALTLPFILSRPVTVGSPAFLPAVAAHSFQIRTAMLLSFAGSALTVYLGITMFPVFRLYSKSVALIFLVVCAVSCTLDVVHAGTIVSMLSIGNEFVTSENANAELYRVIGAAVSSARRSAHIMQLFAIGAWMFVFYLAMFRFKLIPHWLAAIGLIGVVSQFTGVTLMMFLGNRPIGQMAMPLLPIQVSVALWLAIKGFNYTFLQPEQYLAPDHRNTNTKEIILPS